MELILENLGELIEYTHTLNCAPKHAKMYTIQNLERGLFFSTVTSQATKNALRD